MSESTTVHMGENSPEHVAFRLMTLIGNCEGKNFNRNASTGNLADRDWVLRTYAKCLYTVKNPSYVGEVFKANWGE
jgi:hypothetical protein